MNISFRPGKAADAEVVGAICYEAFKAIADQHNFPPDFPDRQTAVGLLSQLLSREDIYSVVAEMAWLPKPMAAWSAATSSGKII